MLSLSGQKDILEELKFEDLDITYFYTRQSLPAGLGHAVGCARDFADCEPFIVALGDSVIYSEERDILLKRMIDWHERNKGSFVIATRMVPVEDVHRYGIIIPGENMTDGIVEIKDLVEKPAPQSAPSNLAIAARYIMPPEVFEALDRTSPGKGGEVQLTDALRLLLKEGIKGYSVRLTDKEKRYDIGNIGSYFEAFVDFALNDEKYGYSLKQYIITKFGL